MRESQSPRELKLREGDELKLVYPQADAEPDRYEDLDFSYFYLQPMDGPDRERNTDLAIRTVWIIPAGDSASKRTVHRVRCLVASISQELP